MNKQKLATAIFATLILGLTIFTFYTPPAFATSYTRNLYFHKVSTKTLWEAGNTTTQIMNTKGTGNWSGSTQYINFICAADDTYYNTTFWLYPKFAAACQLYGTFNTTAFLKANATITSKAYIRSEYIETLSTGANSSVLTGVSGAQSIATTFAAKSYTYSLASPGNTWNADSYIQLKLGIMVNASTAPANITLAYDYSTNTSRIKVPAIDVLDVTSIDTYLDDSARTDFSYMDTINCTGTLASAFGAYDIASSSFWFVPIGTSEELPSGRGAGSRLSGDDDDYTNDWEDDGGYTYGEGEFAGTLWTPHVEITDQDGNTYEETGDRIGITGPGGSSAPSYAPYIPDIFYELGFTAETALMMMIGVTLLIVVIALVVWHVLTSAT
jgi:hypothetical protein